MIKACLSIVLSLIGLIAYSQSAEDHCDGSRYVDETFSNVTITTDVLFGNNTTYAGAQKDLLMDIYEPQGDVATKRPVVVLAFGGSFITGERSDLDELCRYFAARGYVAVTIDYRLYDGPIFPFPTGVVMTDVALKAMGDMKAAIRYLKEDAATTNLYQIDTNYVFAGGASSGAIAANYVAYLDTSDENNSSVTDALNANGGIEGNSSDNFQYSSTVAGVLSYSGAVLDSNVIDAGQAPIFMVHDDKDLTIAYGSGYAVVYGNPIVAIEGSSIMSLRATNLGIKNKLITVPNSTEHVSYFSETSTTWKDSVLYSSGIFLNEIICPSVNSTGPGIELFEVSIYPNPVKNTLTIKRNGLKIIEISIINVLGTTELNVKTGKMTTINVSSLKPGIHYLLANTDQGVITTKFVKH
jgi:para-nitrobenzyl esterase